jgi:starvation-inducible DNA-binding protein
MASTTQAHLPALADPHQRDDVGNQMQATLVELVDLSLLGKQLHWSVVGPLFKPLHEQLDELVDSWRELSDLVAERAVALGHYVDGQSATVAAGSGLHKVERGAVEDHVVVRELTGRLADVAERVRERMDRMGDIDAASQDVLIEVLRELEKQLWMVRAQYPPAGGS